MTSSNGNIFRVTGPVCGEFTGHRWISRTKASDAELWYFLWSAPQSWGWWFKTPTCSLWRHCSVMFCLYSMDVASDVRILSSQLVGRGTASQHEAMICIMEWYSCYHENVRIISYDRLTVWCFFWCYSELFSSVLRIATNKTYVWCVTTKIFVWLGRRLHDCNHCQQRFFIVQHLRITRFRWK